MLVNLLTHTLNWNFSIAWLSVTVILIHIYIFVLQFFFQNQLLIIANNLIDKKMYYTTTNSNNDDDDDDNNNLGFDTCVLRISHNIYFNGHRTINKQRNMNKLFKNTNYYKQVNLLDWQRQYLLILFIYTYYKLLKVT
jgi:hypothetical protein